MQNPQSSFEVFKYRDQIKLSSHLNDLSPPSMTINGTWDTNLGQAEFMAAAALACHSLAKAGQKPPINVALVDYPSANQYIAGIDAFLSGLKNGPRVLATATQADFTTLIKRLRNKVARLGFSPLLINTGPNRRGYRLETAPENVWLHMVHPDTGFVWDIRGVVPPGVV